MANDLRPASRNPFLAAADRIKHTGELTVLPPVTSTKNRSTPKAPLNDIPGHESLMGMIDKALFALSRGVRWARGSILNLLV